MVAFLGHGATIRHGHVQIVWSEGHEATTASESIDAATHTIVARVEAWRGRKE